MKLNAYYSQSKLIFSSREALAFSFNKKNGQWATVVHLTDTNDEFLPDDNTPHYLKTLDNSVLGETTLNFNWFNDIGELDVLSPETEMVEIKNVSHNTSKISNKTVIDLDGLISKTIDAIRSQVLQDI
jgi:hypothetical protein